MHSGGSENTGIGSHMEAIGAADGKTVHARRFPSASVMTGGPAGPSTQCAHDRPTLPAPSVAPTTARTLSGRGALDRA